MSGVPRGSTVTVIGLSRITAAPAAGSTRRQLSQSTPRIPILYLSRSSSPPVRGESELRPARHSVSIPSSLPSLMIAMSAPSLATTVPAYKWPCDCPAFADLIIHTVDKRKFYVHRIIIANASPVVADMLSLPPYPTRRGKAGSRCAGELQNLEPASSVLLPRH